MPLPRVHVGDVIRAEHIQQICAEIEQNRIRQGPGIRTSVSSSGTTVATDNVIRWRSASPGAGNNWATPFAILQGQIIDDFQNLYIENYSYVSVIETGEIVATTGLFEDFPCPAIGDSIWLEITVDGLNVTSSSIWTGKAGVDGWENYPDPVKVETVTPEEGSPYNVVTGSRALIGHIIDPDDPRQGDIYTVQEGDRRKVLQCLTTNLGIQVLIMKGLPVPMLVPWHAPFQVP